MEDPLSSGHGGVDLFGNRCKGNSPAFEVGDEFDQVWDVATESVKPPTGDSGTGQCDLKQFGKRRSRGGGSTVGVGEDAFAAERGQSVALYVEVLLGGLDPRISVFCGASGVILPRTHCFGQFCTVNTAYVFGTASRLVAVCRSCTAAW